MQHIFLETYQAVLCYSRRNKDLMRRFRQALTEAGIQSWVGDYLKVESDYWISSSQQAIENAHGLVVLLTPDAKHAPQIPHAVQHARRHRVPIYAVLADGDLASSVPPCLGGETIIDLRNQVVFNQSLAVPELVDPLLNPPPVVNPRLIPFNPWHQLRLLMWMFWYPARVIEAQERGEPAAVRQTAGWLAASLLFLVLLIQNIAGTLREFDWSRLASMAFLGIGWAYTARQSRDPRWWVRYRWAIVASLGFMLVGLPTLLGLVLDNLSDSASLSLRGWSLTLVMPVVGGLSLGIAEAFQARGILTLLNAVLNAGITALASVSLAAPPLVESAGSGIGVIAVLTLLGVTVGAVAVVVVYAVTFLVANDLVQALYTRHSVSRLGRVVPYVLALCYGWLIVANLLA